MLGTTAFRSSSERIRKHKVILAKGCTQVSIFLRLGIYSQAYSLRNKLFKISFMASTITNTNTPWSRYIMALDDVSNLLQRVCRAFFQAQVPYALVGGQAVALWVAVKDPAAVRTTKDVDVLLSRGDLPRAKAAAMSVGLDYFEVMGVGMFLIRENPNPKHAVHIVWAGEKVRPEYEYPSPALDQRQELSPGICTVSLKGLVQMKLLSNRDQDRVHLRDMIDVGLIGRDLLGQLPKSLADRLEPLLAETGR
jgi:hypothetical protein